jgi:hypothetical protein
MLYSTTTVLLLYNTYCTVRTLRKRNRDNFVRPSTVLYQKTKFVMLKRKKKSKKKTWKPHVSVSIPLWVDFDFLVFSPLIHIESIAILHPTTNIYILTVCTGDGKKRSLSRRDAIRTDCVRRSYKVVRISFPIIYMYSLLWEVTCCCCWVIYVTSILGIRY